MNPEETFWSPAIRGLVPYMPGEQPQIPNLIKLNTNENPYPPSPQVVQAIAAAARQGLQLYPDPRATALREAVAAYHGIHAEQVFAGNGSDEVLAHAFFAFFRHDRPLLMPDPTNATGTLLKGRRVKVLSNAVMPTRTVSTTHRANRAARRRNSS